MITDQLTQPVEVDTDSMSGGTTPKASGSPTGPILTPPTSGPTLTPPSFIQLRISDPEGESPRRREGDSPRGREGESPKKRKGSDLAALEVAGGGTDENQPQLVGIRRLNSGIWAEDAEQVGISYRQGLK